MKITYAEFREKKSFYKEELLAIAWGSFIKDPPSEGFPMLPAPPMLMFDEITEITHSGNRGKIVAIQNIAMDDWFFQCHFRQDPVQPGCLGVDAIWQLIGFYIATRGGIGAGRALGTKEIDFFGQIRPHNKIVRYSIDIRRFTNMPEQGASLAIGSAEVFVDDELIYTIKDAKVGSFTGIQYSDYPHKSKNFMGGQLIRTNSEPA